MCQDIKAIIAFNNALAENIILEHHQNLSVIHSLFSPERDHAKLSDTRYKLVGSFFARPILMLPILKSEVDLPENYFLPILPKPLFLQNHS